MVALVSIFSVLSIALTLSPIGRMRISWDDLGITLKVFPKKAEEDTMGRLRKNNTRSPRLSNYRSHRTI